MTTDTAKPWITEIYVCRLDERLDDAKLVSSEEIETKHQAAVDAEARCLRDPEVARIFYYRVREDGRFRCLHAHINTEALLRRRRRPGAAPEPIQLHRAREMLRREENSLWSRLVRAVAIEQKAVRRAAESRIAR